MGLKKDSFVEKRMFLLIGSRMKWLRREDHPKIEAEMEWLNSRPYIVPSLNAANIIRLIQKHEESPPRWARIKVRTRHHRNPPGLKQETRLHLLRYIMERTGCSEEDGVQEVLRWEQEPYLHQGMLLAHVTRAIRDWELPENLPEWITDYNI